MRVLSWTLLILIGYQSLSDQKSWTLISLQFPNPIFLLPIRSLLSLPFQPNRTLFPGCRSLSIDDVMRLVDTEEGDIVLLTELTLSRDTTGLSGEETSGMEEEEENGTEDSRTTTTATSWSSTSTSASKGKGRREEEGRGVAGSKPG